MSPHFLIPEESLSHWVVESPGRGLPDPPHGTTWFSAVSVPPGADPVSLDWPSGCRTVAGPFCSRGEAEAARDALYLAADVMSA